MTAEEYNLNATPPMFLRLGEDVQLERQGLGRRAARRALGLPARGGESTLLGSFVVAVATDRWFGSISPAHEARLASQQMAVEIPPELMAEFPFTRGQLHASLYGDNVQRYTPRLSRYRWAVIWSELVSPGSGANVPQRWSKADQVGVRVITPAPAEYPTTVNFNEIPAVARVDTGAAATLLRLLNDSTQRRGRPLTLDEVAAVMGRIQVTPATAEPAVFEEVAQVQAPKRILRIPPP